MTSHPPPLNRENFRAMALTLEMAEMREQAEWCGAEVITDDVISVDFSKRPFTVTSPELTLKTHAVIIATGSSARRLRIPSEDEFWGRGIASCAICDGATPMFREQELVVVGGGDSACEMATYLTAVFTVAYETDPSMRATMARAPRPLAEVTAEQCFAEADTDNDGRLSFAEFQAWYTGEDYLDGDWKCDSTMVLSITIVVVLVAAAVFIPVWNVLVARLDLVHHRLCGT